MLKFANVGYICGYKWVVCNTNRQDTDMKQFTSYLLLLLLLTMSCNNDEISPEIEKGLLKNQVIAIGGV
ncbi:MAG: hypothetical protein EA393_05535, partial [Bacteroidetes bacterium]